MYRCWVWLCWLVVCSWSSTLSICAVETSSQATETLGLFQTDFGPDSDRNFDGWPDGWEREVSAKYPHYLKMGLVKPTVDVGSTTPAHALRVDLDGGGAWIRSPEIAINPLFMYALEVQVHTSKLERNAAYISLSFYDNKQKLVEHKTSKSLQNSVGWQTLNLGPVLPSKQTIVKAVIGLHLEPMNKASDLRGFAEFATVRLNRVPRITLNSSRQDRIYFQPEQPEIICQASGFHDPNARVIFEVFDQHGQKVDVNELPLRKQSVAESTTSTAPKPVDQSAVNPEKKTVYSGEVHWRPTLKEAGYYRVRVQMPGELGIVNRRELSLIVLKPLPVLTQGEFGWSLPDGEGPLSMSDLADLAGGSGIHWLKMPVWKASSDKQRADQLVWFAERMSLKRVNLVGVLSDPPDQVRNAVSGGQTDLAAGIFSAPNRFGFRLWNRLLAVSQREYSIGNLVKIAIIVSLVFKMVRSVWLWSASYSRASDNTCTLVLVGIGCVNGPRNKLPGVL